VWEQSLNHDGVVTVEGWLMVNHPFGVLGVNVVLYVVPQEAAKGTLLVLVDLSSIGKALITVN
jgi:hypothetical protein